MWLALATITLAAAALAFRVLALTVQEFDH
jgi:hypothetical protein